MKIQNVIKHIESSQNELVDHDIYSKISTIQDLRIFMENHIGIRCLIPWSILAFLEQV